MEDLGWGQRYSEDIEVLTLSSPSCCVRPLWPQSCPSPSQVIRFWLTAALCVPGTLVVSHRVSLALVSPATAGRARDRAGLAWAPQV